jgi:predicted transcriptional regulator
MTKTMVSARIPVELDRKLEAMAAAEKRSKSYIVEEALQIHAEREAWMIAEAEASAREADESGEWYSNELVMEWLISKTTSNPLPFPKPDILRSKSKP